MNSVNNGEAFAALIQRWKSQNPTISNIPPPPPSFFLPSYTNQHHQPLGYSPYLPSIPPPPSLSVSSYRHHTNYPRESSSYPNYPSFHSNQFVSNSSSRSNNMNNIYFNHSSIYHPTKTSFQKFNSRNSNTNTDNNSNSNSDSNSFSETSIHYCEPCDKELPMSAYNAHMATHETCHHAGCSFSATKKVISAHYHAVHGTYSGSGFKTIIVDDQKFCVLLGSNPEEIELWRAERRKKFPTVANIRLKREQNATFVEAGGILLHNKEYRFKGRQKRNRDEKIVRTSVTIATNHPNKKHSYDRNIYSPKFPSDDSASSQNHQSSLLTSTLSSMDNLMTITATTAITTKVQEVSEDKPLEQPVESASLHSLTTNLYPDVNIPIMEDNNILHDELSNKFTEENHLQSPNICRNFVKGRCKRGSSCRFSHESIPNNRNMTKNQLHSENNCDPLSLHTYQNRPGKRQNGLFLPAPLNGGKYGSLLQHLLQDSIETDHDIILQSIRYLVQNNFFDDSDPSSSSLLLSPSVVVAAAEMETIVKI